MYNAAISLSGGVDSAAAALLLQADGIRPVGIYLRHSFQPTLTPEEEAHFFAENGPAAHGDVYTPTPAGGFERTDLHAGLFRLPRAAADAYRVAAALDIPFCVFDAEPLFRRVTSDFVTRYLEGQTPNPCVLCNRTIKFGALIELAESLGARRFATGHYALRMTKKDWLEKNSQDDIPQTNLLRDVADDTPLLVDSGNVKDQSYFLWGINRQILPRLLFPVGALDKSEVRRIAAAQQLPITSGGESQDLCFVPNGKTADFIRQHGDGRGTAGRFVSLDGTVLGQHTGYEKFTVGQRKGLGTGFGERIFVQRIDAETRSVVLGPSEALARTEVVARNANWLLDVPQDQPFRCEVKIRCRSRSVPACVTVSSDGMIHARLDEPRTGIAPGQSLVCRLEGVLLGGGVIQSTEGCPAFP